MIRLALALLLTLPACSPTFRFELLPRAEDPAIGRWRSTITASVNDIECRVQKLEGKETVECQTRQSPTPTAP